MKLFIITVIQDKIDLKSKTCEKVHTVVKKKIMDFGVHTHLKWL